MKTTLLPCKSAQPNLSNLSCWGWGGGGERRRKRRRKRRRRERKKEKRERKNKNKNSKCSTVSISSVCSLPLPFCHRPSFPLNGVHTQHVETRDGRWNNKTTTVKNTPEPRHRFLFLLLFCGVKVLGEVRKRHSSVVENLSSCGPEMSQ